MKWIKCSDRQPEYKTWVLGLTPSGFVHVVERYEGLGYCGDIDGGWYANCDILYWMPLPALPKGFVPTPRPYSQSLADMIDADVLNSTYKNGV